MKITGFRIGNKVGVNKQSQIAGDLYLQGRTHEGRIVGFRFRPDPKDSPTKYPPIDMFLKTWMEFIAKGIQVMDLDLELVPVSTGIETETALKDLTQTIERLTTDNRMLSEIIEKSKEENEIIQKSLKKMMKRINNGLKKHDQYKKNI